MLGKVGSGLTVSSVTRMLFGGISGGFGGGVLVNWVSQVVDVQRLDMVVVNTSWVKSMANIWKTF